MPARSLKDGVLGLLLGVDEKVLSGKPESDGNSPVPYWICDITVVCLSFHSANPTASSIISPNTSLVSSIKAFWFFHQPC